MVTIYENVNAADVVNLLLLISAAMVYIIVSEKETKMNLTFEPDFELLYPNKERYNNFERQFSIL